MRVRESRGGRVISDLQETWGPHLDGAAADHVKDPGLKHRVEQLRPRRQLRQEHLLAVVRHQSAAVVATREGRVVGGGGGGGGSGSDVGLRAVALEDPDGENLPLEC